MEPSELLKQKIDEEAKVLENNFGGESYWAIQNIVRRIDFILPLFWKREGWSKQEIDTYREFFNYGWAPVLKQYYTDINLNVYQPFPLMTNEMISWADSNIQFSGKIEFCKQLLEYEKAGLISITNPKENEFTFSYLHEVTGIEQFDKMSMDFYRNQIVERIISEKKKAKTFDEEKIKAELRKIIKSPDGKMISYDTTPEIDEYYNQRGHYHILRLQGYDDFDTKDKFGGIEYWKYVDIVELVTGIAIMHMEACLELVKMNPEVNLLNILSYTHYKDKAISSFSNYLGVGENEIEQIFSCLTLTKENFDYYLEYPSTPPPMYFQVSENLTIRSIAGCLSNPFSILNRELKRKYRSDYDKAVNRREDRFRNELFMFFPNERIIKIPREINISYNGIKTDIDAVIFDSKTGTLGIFQLKWQDPYAKDMTERYSRMTNLFPKANEWVSKMKYWVTNNTSKTIINSLQINKQLKEKIEVKEICCFVISRNQMNFTGMEITDETVAWSSWHQLIESQARIKTDIDDPIREMFVKIKSFSPEKRMNMEELPKAENIEVQIGKIKVFYKNKSR